MLELSQASIPSASSSKLFFTREECAEIFRVSVRTVNSLLKNREIRFRKIGGSVRIPCSEILRLTSLEETANSR